MSNDREAMKVMVVYDSMYGNTQQIAQAIGEALGSQAEVGVYRVGELRPEQLVGLDLLVVGSPTQRFNATPAVSSLLNSLPPGALKGRRVAAFDTRLTEQEMKSMSSVLSFSARLAGASAYAAKHIASAMQKKGGELVAPPEGFYVEGGEGPLVEGELERAAAWARQILLS
jgi:flavodoxin